MEDFDRRLVPFLTRTTFSIQSYGPEACQTFICEIKVVKT